MVLLEAILHEFMSVIAKRAEIAKEWTGRVVPKVTKKLVKLELDSRTCRVTPAGTREFLVQDGNTNFTINLNTGHYDCMFWDISRIPCKHAIRCILRERLDPETFVHEAFSIDKYRLAYSVVIHPVQDQSFWETRNLPKLGPPPIDKVRPGRPETSRRKDVTKSIAFKRSSTIKCSKYGQYGHNSKSHKGKGGALVLKSEKRRYTRSSKRKVRGRPPKDGRVIKR